MNAALNRKLTVILFVVVLFAMFYTNTVYADETHSGMCGENVNWSFQENEGTLVIEGSGAMDFYLHEYEIPWKNIKGNIKTVTVKDGVTRISDFAFSDCSRLTSITISNSVEEIAYYAFDNCAQLSNIYYGGPVEKWLTILMRPLDCAVNCIDETGCYLCGIKLYAVFDDSTGTLTIKGDGSWFAYENIDAPWYSFRDQIKTVIIEGTDDIVEGAFRDCSNLSTIIMPNDTERFGFGPNAFEGCNNLKSFSMPNNVTFINKDTFKNSSLKEIIYDGTIEEWMDLCPHKIGIKINCKGGKSYYPCGKNAYAIFEESTGTLTVKGNGAIYSYNHTINDKTDVPWNDIKSDIQNLIIEEGITETGIQTFNRCENLTSINFPNSLERIDAFSFIGCKSLENIIIPVGVKGIYGYAFAESGLKQVNFNGTEEQWNLVNIAETSGILELRPQNQLIANYTVKFDSNGGSDIELQNVRAGEKVIIPENPIRSGYIFAGWYIDEKLTEKFNFETAINNNITLYAKWNAKGGGSSGSSGSKPINNDENKESENYFVDINEKDYFYNAVLWAFGKDITKGISANEFKPYGKCTRAEMVTFLWRAAGSPQPDAASSQFMDVNINDYYGKAVLWAAENDITSGVTYDKFEPDSNITRGQAITFLYRFAKPLDVEKAASFEDVSNNAYYYNAVNWAVRNGITTGKSNAIFAPKDICTRNEIVTLLYRYFEN